MCGKESASSAVGSVERWLESGGERGLVDSVEEVAAGSLGFPERDIVRAEDVEVDDLAVFVGGQAEDVGHIVSGERLFGRVGGGLWFAGGVCHTGGNVVESLSASLLVEGIVVCNAEVVGEVVVDLDRFPLDGVFSDELSGVVEVGVGVEQVDDDHVSDCVTVAFNAHRTEGLRRQYPLTTITPLGVGCIYTYVMSQKVNTTDGRIDRELQEAKKTVHRLLVALTVGITVGLCWILGVVEGNMVVTALVGWGISELARFVLYDGLRILRLVVRRA